MKLLTRYLAREIYASIALVLTALLMLFSFLDLINELSKLGQGSYNMGYVLLFIALTLPTHIYELFPVAILIGSILALVQMAANSELTIYRASGASLQQMAMALLKITLPLVVISFLCGDVLAPHTKRLAQSLRLKAQNAEITLKEFRSGVWAKDARSFVNAKSVLPDTSMLNVSIYKFDENYRLQTIVTANRATFLDENTWQLEDVTQTKFENRSTMVNKYATLEWQSGLNPDLLGVLLLKPEHMSAWSLYQYTKHMRENRQKTARYEIAMWNKLIYPLVAFVMMMLALPFAAHQKREGGISAKVFTGIVLGLSFHFIGRLFGNLGALNDWNPLLSALAIPLLFLLLAGGMLWWTERR